ncbi:MAG: YigZ family protein [Aestuariibacter sp.]
MSSYLIPAENTVFEESIKSSRFVTYLAHCENMDAARAFVNQIKEKHADARHNCWAFAAGAPGDSNFFGCSDDGEPSGTAGKPMLAQLSGSNIGEIVAVTARYFGGTKLGTGGLVKAYGGGVNQALKQLATKHKVLTETLKFEVPFEWQNLFENTCQSLQVDVKERHYRNKIDITLSCPIDNIEQLQQRLVHGSKGQIHPILK